MKSQASKAGNYLYELQKGGVVLPGSPPAMAKEVVSRHRPWRTTIQTEQANSGMQLFTTKLFTSC